MQTTHLLGVYTTGDEVVLPDRAVGETYALLRARGVQASRAWGVAKALRRWARSNDTRLRYVPDKGPDLSWLEQTDEEMGRGFQRQAKAELERANRDGCWGLVGEYRIGPGEPWEEGDSVWGFIGDDGLELDGYLADIIRTTMDTLEDARASVCPTCGRPRL